MTLPRPLSYLWTLPLPAPHSSPCLSLGTGPGNISHTLGTLLVTLVVILLIILVVTLAVMLVVIFVVILVVT